MNSPTIFPEVVDSLNLFIKEYGAAQEKHPFFAHSFAGQTTPEGMQYFLKRAREKLERQIKAEEVEATTVLHCEVVEAVEAYVAGRYDDALTELAQCGAVLLRMMSMVRNKQKEVEK